MNNGFGFNKKGFNKRTFSNIIEKIEKLLREQSAFGNEMIWNEQEPFYQLNVVNAYFWSELWEVAEQVAYSSSPKYAEGNVLDAKCKLIGIYRKRGNTSKGKITIEGREGTIIPKTFQVSTGEETNIVFKVLKESTIPQSGKITMEIESLEKGEFTNVPKMSINNIITPVIGVTKVYNSEPTSNGEYAETDIELRERYNASVSRTTTNIYDSILSNILAVAGVKDAILKVNDQMETIEHIPPKSFHAVVHGGQDKDVAKAIFEKYPGGIQPFGNVVVKVKDRQGIEHNIGFSKPYEIKTWVKCKITKNGLYPIDGDSMIKKILNSYINNLKIGKDIVIYKLISAIDKEGIEGIEDIEISLSVDGKEYKEENISIESLAVATTQNENIEVI